MTTMRLGTDETLVRFFSEMTTWAQENPDADHAQVVTLLAAAVDLDHMTVNFAVDGQHFTYHRGAIGTTPTVRLADAEDGRHWTPAGTRVEWADQEGGLHQGTSTGLYGACLGLDAHYQVLPDGGTETAWVLRPMPL